MAGLASQTKEQVFMSLIQGMERMEDREKYHNRVFWLKDGYVFFEHEEVTGKLWCSYKHVWSIFETTLGLKYADIQTFIRAMFESQFQIIAVPWFCTSVEAVRWKRISKAPADQLDFLNDKQRWVVNECRKTPQYIENKIFVSQFHLLFYPERKVRNSESVSGWDKFHDIHLTRKEISKIFGQLRKFGVLSKKAYGIQGHKDAWLFRSWVWSWSITDKYK